MIDKSPEETVEQRDLADIQFNEEIAAKHPLLILVKRLSILLFSMSFLSLLFWGAGNFSDFLDETELMLLGVLRYSGCALIAVSFFGLVITSAIKSGRNPGQRVAGALGYLFLFIFGAAGALISELIHVLSSGIK